MGCSVRSMSRKIHYTDSQPRIHSVKEIVVQPGIFVFKNDCMFQEVYKIGGVLGSGTYGEVRLCHHRDTCETRAVKIFKKQLYQSEIKREKLLSEISILKSLDHPNIIRIYEYFEDIKVISTCYE